MLISDAYRELNKRLHEARPDYGTSGRRYVPVVRQLMAKYETSDVLDYGAGKCTLQEALGHPIANYDPCVPGLDAVPGPHDIVVCTDVLEHIEPDCLAEVLKDIRRCTKKAAYLFIATRPAAKVLAEGRNAHLIQQPYAWWERQLAAAGFRPLQMHQHDDGEFAVIVG